MFYRSAETDQINIPQSKEDKILYLTVHFLVNSLLSLVDGSNMFCHVALH